ncbi:hypothetical protein P4O66_019553 [Electrophorus voltai]|uniref:Sidekick cell adhesion molecule 1b n=1 Tax=Electrophorus voltai TaxID=2609070 RepID=A0AAD8ZTS3_9TELE|nr:hypothetical protein P4O66_019553 [Electrophorus voltai]
MYGSHSSDFTMGVRSIIRGPLTSSEISEGNAFTKELAGLFKGQHLKRWKEEVERRGEPGGASSLHDWKTCSTKAETESRRAPSHKLTKKICNASAYGIKNITTYDDKMITPNIKRSSSVKNCIWNERRKFVLCAWCWWAFFCLHIHVLKAVAQGLHDSLCCYTVHKKTEVKKKKIPRSSFLCHVMHERQDGCSTHSIASWLCQACDVAPYFKTEPGRPETHLEGNRLVLTCLAEGSWPLEFRWMLNGTDITAFSPEYKYIIPSLQHTDMGAYQCVVRNRMGALLQRRAEIHVAYMGNYVEGDQRKTVTQGRAAVLNSPAVSSFPRPQVTWFMDGYKIIPSSRVVTDSKYSVTHHSQKILLENTISDSFQLHSTGTLQTDNENDNEEFTIILPVRSPPSKDLRSLLQDGTLQSPETPETPSSTTISISHLMSPLLSFCPEKMADLKSQLAMALKGEEMRGEKQNREGRCRMEKKQRRKKKGVENKVERAITLENQLVVLATAATDAGRYYVQAFNEKNGENKTSPNVYLNVAGKHRADSLSKKNRGAHDADAPAGPVAPVIVIAPRNTTVTAGVSKATMECVANARPVEKLNLVWRRNGVEVASGVGSFGRRLTIVNPTSADVGLYVCEASLLDSSMKHAEARAFLSIIESPYFTVEPRRKMMGEVEKSVDIPCQARGVPTPKLEWYKDAVPLSRLSNPRYKVTSSGGLQVRRLQPNDTGIFQCFARNAAGEAQVHTYLDVTSMAPAFSTPPANITVTDGTVATFTCQVSGAPKPAIVWKKDAQILASGSVKIPRFALLESGGLQVQPVVLQDMGTYTCYAANMEGTVNASADLTVWSRTYISQPPTDRRVIKGTTAILECGATHDPRVSVRFVWKKDGEMVGQSRGGRISLQEGSLHITQTWSGDIGDYTCDVLSPAGNDSKATRLEVIELPHSPRHLQARLNATDSRSVELLWMRPFDGNSPLLHYVVELSENNSPWRVYLANVNPALTTTVVTGLTPARTYQFRVCAVNQVGKGQYSTQTNRLMLREEPPSAPPKNIVASGRTNQSIMVQWQPPPEPQLNGVLRGYVLRYRLAGLPGEYQQQNITSPEINYCLITELIIWTQYEIQVAAYTGAGLGVFSPPVIEYTLQGVPTAPPQGVEAIAVNSTTIKFTWNPPPQQFINGINQGYKLSAWPEHSPEDTIVVTITPDYHGTRHLAYVSGLKKFTWYLTSVLCFTTPGNGPRSAPRLVQTHEDSHVTGDVSNFNAVPGPVGRLSFTEILDTSLRVSWEEPVEKNGVITGKCCTQLSAFSAGYLLSWEAQGKNQSRVAQTMPNTTLEYKVTGLTSLTTYTLEVAAITAAGIGMITSSTISSGVPPELPGPPSNLVISKISPRSATLKFRAGDDGKTAISKWIVEGQNEVLSAPTMQVGSTGEEEEWKVLYEKDNDPEAQVLEVPNLTPFTFYRFRMRQANVVGSSKTSEPSRLIQTLQAPPDAAPSSVSVRTASETSVWLRWVPLPETEYNGNPESVGYRLRVWRADQQGEVSTRVVSDRLEREITLEGLEEWTEYLLQIQAFNSIGPGPWSEPVRGRTRESVPSGAPDNVTAEAMSSTHILVTWGPVPDSEQNGNILGYKILYREQDSNAEPQVQVVKGNLTQSTLLRNLRKYVLYEIQVLAFTRIGDGQLSSPPVLERTKDDVPGPPVRLVFPEVRLTEVRVVWQSPVDANGIIIGYQVAYRLDSGEPNQFTTVDVGPNTKEFTASALSQESAYIFRISARTQQGWGTAAQAVVITTEIRERPQPPLQLSVPQDQVQSRRLWLEWVPGRDGSSPVRYFTLQLRQLPDGGWITHSSAISHNSTSCVVDREQHLCYIADVGKGFCPMGDNSQAMQPRRLKPYTSYKLRMMATNDIGDSKYSQETDAITTLQDVPDEAPVIQSVKPSTTTSVLVQWQSPKEESVNGVLLGYRLYYRELQYDSTPLDSKKAINSSVARGDLTGTSRRRESIRLNRERQALCLSPWLVMDSQRPGARNPGEDTSGATPLGRGFSHGALPSPHVTCNGFLISLFFCFSLSPLSPPAKSTVKTVSSPSLMEFELTHYNARCSLHSRGQELQKYRRYEIVMTTYNIIGESPASAPVEVFVGEAAPSVAPQNIQVNTMSSTQLEVQWEPPPVETQNGIIQGYKIYYWEIENQNETEKVKILFLPETSVRLKNLTSYTYYMVKLSAFNAAGDGPLSEPRKGRTLQAAPSAPSFISFSEVTSTAVNVSWGLPLTANGVVDGYRVVYEPSAPIHGVTKVITVDIRGSWQRWLKVRDLTKGVTYCFRVQARTISYGPEVTANVTAGPVEGAPGSPLKISLMKSGSTLTIHWAPGDGGAGHVTGYAIEARPSDEALWDTFVRHLPPSTTSHSVSLERLRQGVSYQFRVLAINEYGYGEPSAPSAAMSAQPETPFYEEWWFLLVLALCGLILLLLLVFGLVLHGQSRKYKSCGTGAAVSTMEESVTLDNGGFTALELNSRPVHVKSSFLRRNGTRSPPRPNPAGLRYSDEDICNNYNGAISTECTALTERPADLSESETQATDSDCEEDQLKHSFVNHYMSDPSYFNSWKRQQKGLKQTLACSYEERVSSDADGYYQTVVTQHSVGGVYTPAGQPAPGSRTPITGFSSFV